MIIFMLALGFIVIFGIYIAPTDEQSAKRDREKITIELRKAVEIFGLTMVEE